MPSSSASAVAADTKSKWETFFKMDVPSASVSQSYDDSASAQSSFSRGSQRYSYSASEDYNDCDSDRENRSGKKLSFLYGRRDKKNEPNMLLSCGSAESTDDHSDDESNNMISKIVNKLSENISNTQPITLIPFNNSGQTQYMILAPKGVEHNGNNTMLLSPQSFKTVALKRGLSNSSKNSSTKKKIFQVKTKKSPEKKQFMKVNPKNLEKKYDQFQTKRKKQVAERRDDNTDRRRKETNKREDDLREPSGLVKSISNLFYPREKQDEDERSEKNQKQRNVFSFSKSPSTSSSSKKDIVGLEVTFPSDEMTSPEKKKGSSKFLKMFQSGKRKGLWKGRSTDTNPSENSIRPTHFGKRIGFAKKLTIEDFSNMNENDNVTNEMVVYYYFSGDPKQSMECISSKEKLIPEKDSEEVLVQVEVS